MRIDDEFPCDTFVKVRVALRGVIERDHRGIDLCSAISRQAGRSVNRGEGLGPVWHDAPMLRLAEILIGLVCETLRWLRLAVRSNRKRLGIHVLPS